MCIRDRYDGTSRFRKDKRWNLFPSFSLGWNMAQENFWESLYDTINLFKLRVSYEMCIRDSVNVKAQNQCNEK